MQFKVKDIGADGVDVSLAVSAAWLARECPDVELSPTQEGEGVRFVGRLERSGDDFLLRGRLTGGLLTSCARCLEPASLPLAVEVSVMYVERSEHLPEDEEALEAPDVLAFEDGVIDLTAELRDEILLALPVSTVCREECVGLCPVCGGNRNVTACDCIELQRMQQSKLAALGKLKI
jgi:uncharacterized protein